jgi:hypothetical protein
VFSAWGAIEYCVSLNLSGDFHSISNDNRSDQAVTESYVISQTNSIIFPGILQYFQGHIERLIIGRETPKKTTLGPHATVVESRYCQFDNQKQLKKVKTLPCPSKRCRGNSGRSLSLHLDKR